MSDNLVRKIFKEFGHVERTGEEHMTNRVYDSKLEDKGHIRSHTFSCLVLVTLRCTGMLLKLSGKKKSCMEKVQ